MSNQRQRTGKNREEPKFRREGNFGCREMIIGSFLDRGIGRAQAHANAVVMHEFITGMNPKFRGPNWKWQDFKKSAVKMALATAYQSFSDGEWAAWEGDINDAVGESAKHMADEVLKTSGVLDWWSEDTSSYVAMAYRWGDLNNHEWYVLGVSADLSSLKTLCDEYNQDRGGKYGCAIHKIDGTSRSDLLEIAYYVPSLRGEEKPSLNARTEAARTIGLAVLEAMEFGTTHLPDEDTPKTNILKSTKVTLPKWLKNEARRKLEFWSRFYPDED